MHVVANQGAKSVRERQRQHPVLQRRACWHGVFKALVGRGCPERVDSDQSWSTAGLEKSCKSDAQPLLIGEPPAELAVEALRAFPCFAKFQTDFQSFGGLSVLGLREFCAQLGMGISIIDLDRLHALANTSKTGKITLTEFTHAVSTIPFFRSLLAAMISSLHFAVGREYDYSRSTYENYGISDGVADESEPRSDEADNEMHHARIALRFQLDTFGFSNVRKRWQNSIVLRTCVGASLEPEEAPWIFVSIAPGVALPGTVLSWMAQHGFCHQRNFVHLQKERLIHCMPELPIYLRRHDIENAVFFVDNEASVLEALSCEVSMRRRRHIWLDCMPRDVAHLVELLPGLRSRHPEYRVCLLDIKVDTASVQHRCRQALRNTGRELVEDSDPPAEHTLNALISCSDIHACIENSEEQPVLLQLRTVESSGCWGALAQHLSGELLTAREIAFFPYALRPLRLERLTVNSTLLTGCAPPLGQKGSLTIDVNQCGSALGCHRSAHRLADALRTAGADVSSFSFPTSLTHSSSFGGREAMLMESDTKIERCAWLQGRQGIFYSNGRDVLSQESLRDLDVDPNCLIARLLRRGGFVFFGGKSQGDKAMLLCMPTDARSPIYLQFSPPRVMPSGAVHVLGGRWGPVTDEALIRQGAEKESWLTPGEDIAGLKVPESGAFAYLLKDQVAITMGCAAIYFSILC